MSIFSRFFTAPKTAPEQENRINSTPISGNGIHIEKIGKKRYKKRASKESKEILIQELGIRLASQLLDYDNTVMFSYAKRNNIKPAARDESKAKVISILKDHYKGKVL